MSRQVTTYQVQPGDTLQSIAASEYGNANSWPNIYNANLDRIKSPEALYPGQTIIIP